MVSQFIVYRYIIDQILCHLINVLAINQSESGALFLSYGSTANLSPRLQGFNLTNMIPRVITWNFGVPICKGCVACSCFTGILQSITPYLINSLLELHQFNSFKLLLIKSLFPLHVKSIALTSIYYTI